MNKEFENKTRGAEYYISVAEKVKKETCVPRKKLLEILGEVDQEQGFRAREAKGMYTTLDTFVKIFQSGGKLIISEERTPDAERKRGVRSKQSVYMLDDTTDIRTYVENYYNRQDSQIRAKKSQGGKRAWTNKKAAAPVITVTERDRVIRDAYVKVSAELIRKNPGMTQSESIKKAKKMVKLNEKEIKLVWNILLIGKQTDDGLFSKKYLSEKVFRGAAVPKDKLKKLSRKLNYYGVRFSLNIIEDKASGGTVKLINDSFGLLKDVERLAKVLFPKLVLEDNTRGNKLKPIENSPVTRVVRTKASNVEGDRLTPEIKKLLYVIGGVIMSRDGKAINITQLCEILEGNNYFRINEGPQGIFEIVKQFPEFFERSNGSDRNAIAFAVPFKRQEIWTKIKNLCSPKYQVKEIPWLINSGLTLEEIQEYFPDSYMEYPDYNKNVVMIKMTESMKDFMTLGQLYQRMRECDVPLGQSPDLIARLKLEIKMQNARVRAMYVKDTLVDFNWAGTLKKDTRKNFEFDKLMYTIEEML